MDEKYKMFSELNENMRFYGGMRFKQLTLLLAATGVLLGVQFGKITLINFKWLIPSIGFVLTGVFWIMEKRSSDAYWHFRKLAEEVEKNFEFKMFTLLKPAKIFSATIVVHILHGIFLIMWIIFLVNELMGEKNNYYF